MVAKPIVIPGPGPTGDSDGDGIVDPTDRYQAVAAGAFDNDHDGCPGPFARISITATITWASTSRKGIKVSAFYVADAPKGATVEVLCPARKTCPYAQKFTATGKRLTLSKFAHKTLKPGTSIAIRVTQAGMTGNYVTKTVKKIGPGRKGLAKFAKEPLMTTRQCVPQGLTTPAKMRIAGMSSAPPRARAACRFARAGVEPSTNDASGKCRCVAFEAEPEPVQMVAPRRRTHSLGRRASRDVAGHRFVELRHVASDVVEEPAAADAVGPLGPRARHCERPADGAVKPDQSSTRPCQSPMMYGCDAEPL